MRFIKNRRKGKRNLPFVDRFVKPSKSASWFIRIFLLNASSGSSSQNEIRVFLFFLSVLVVLRVKDDYYKIYMSHIYIYISLLRFKSKTNFILLYI